MKITLEIDLEDYDCPSYCDRVNHALASLLKDPDFLDGKYRSGRVWFFHMGQGDDACMTRVTGSYFNMHSFRPK